MPEMRKVSLLTSQAHTHTHTHTHTHSPFTNLNVYHSQCCPFILVKNMSFLKTLQNMAHRAIDFEQPSLVKIMFIYIFKDI